MPNSNRSSVALIVILIASGLLGMVFGQRVQTAQNEDADMQQNLRHFTQVYDVVEQNYAEPVKPDKAIYDGAIPYLLRLETQDGLATQLNTMNTLGLPKDYLETYTTRVRSVEPDQVLAAAKKYMAPGQATVVVVGDASKIAEALKKFGDVTITKAN